MITISKEPTKYILVRATCSNEHTSIGTCLISLQEGDVDIWKERKVNVLRMAEDTNKDEFWSAEWLYNYTIYLTYDIEEDEIPMEGDWSYVSFENEEDKDQFISEHEMDEHVEANSLSIDKYGQISFKGFGKYSSDIYETSDIGIDHLEEVDS